MLTNLSNGRTYLLFKNVLLKVDCAICQKQFSDCNFPQLDFLMNYKEHFRYEEQTLT